MEQIENAHPLPYDDLRYSTEEIPQIVCMRYLKTKFRLDFESSLSLGPPCHLVLTPWGVGEVVFGESIRESWIPPLALLPKSQMHRYSLIFETDLKKKIQKLFILNLLPSLLCLLSHFICNLLIVLLFTCYSCFCIIIVILFLCVWQNLLPTH